jgi:hypothetical protein
MARYICKIVGEGKRGAQAPEVSVFCKILLCWCRSRLRWLGPAYACESAAGAACQQLDSL